MQWNGKRIVISGRCCGERNISIYTYKYGEGKLLDIHKHPADHFLISKLSLKTMS